MIGTRVATVTVVILSMVVSLQGCAIIKYTGSQVADPSIPKKMMKMWRPGMGGANLSAPGVFLEVQVQNQGRVGGVFMIFPVPGRRVPRPLRIWINLDPEDDSFSFDPGRVVLTTSYGEDVTPVGYWGPGIGGPQKKAHYRCGIPSMDAEKQAKAQKRARRAERLLIGSPSSVHYDECFNCDKPSKSVVKTPDGPIRLHGPSCFVLLFDVSPRPKNEFRLSIDGVVRGGETVELPDVPFEKASYTDVAMGG